MSITASSQQRPTAGPAVPAGAGLRLVEEVPDEGSTRRRARNVVRDEEHDLQGHALALESHCLRRRAERYAEAAERGAVPADEQVVAVLRAFRAYRPFLFAADRASNDAARGRLSRAVADARARRHDVGSAPDASVA